jgi:hypothetical protein
MVRFVCAKNGPSSLASIPPNTRKNLNTMYAICVSANCCPGQILGPPLKGMYSQLPARQHTEPKYGTNQPPPSLLCHT